MGKVDLKEVEVSRDYSDKQALHRTQNTDESLDSVIHGSVISSDDSWRVVKKEGLVSKLIGKANTFTGGIVYGSIGGILTGLYITLNSSYHGSEKAIWGLAWLFPPYFSTRISKRAKTGAVVGFASSAMLIPLAPEIWNFS